MRELDPTLSDIQRRLNRQYRIKILLYDVVSQAAQWTVADVVAGRATPSGDISVFARDINLTSQQLSFVLEDPAGQFDPDFGSSRHLLAESQMVRVIEGDAQVAEEFWEPVFTGHVRGQLGWTINRSNRIKQAMVQCLDRMSVKSFNRMPATTQSYTEGVDLGEVAYDIASTIMCLSADEIAFDRKWGHATCHRFLQIVELPALEALRKVGEPVGYVPFFNGRGQLDFYQKYINPEEGFGIQGKLDIPWARIREMQIPATGPRDMINKVRVLGLDCRMSLVMGEWAKLWSGTITTGFFETAGKIKVDFGEDDTSGSVKAITGLGFNLIPGMDILYETNILNFVLDMFFGPEGYITGLFTTLDKDCRLVGLEDIFKGIIGLFLPSFRVLKSVNDSLIPFHSMEIYTPSGFHGGQIRVQNFAWVPGLAVMATAGLIAAANSPDIVTTAPGVTTPTGRIAEATFLGGILLILMSQGSGNYEVWGMPFDFVYREIENIAVLPGVEFWAENELEIQNDIIDNCRTAEAVATRELLYQQQLGTPRNITMVHDLHIEPGDIIRLPDGRVYTISDWNYNVNRVEQDPAVPMVNYYCLRSSIEEPVLSEVAMTVDGYIARIVDVNVGARNWIQGTEDYAFAGKAWVYAPGWYG